jgi:hypothetical protein
MATQKIGDMTVDDLKAALGSGSNSSATKPTVDWEFLKSLGKDAVTVGGALGQLTKGASGSALAVKAFGDVVGAVSPSLGNALKDAGTAALENKAKLDEATRSSFATNDIFKYNREAAQAGVTTEQWNKLLKDSGPSIYGLTGNAARSAEQFSSLTREVRESNLGQQLQAFGVSQEELANYTALYLSNNRKLNLADADARNKAKEAAELLALQITETAAATGQSRDAVASKTKAELDNVDSILIMNRMTEEQRAAFTKTTVELTKLGPSVESLGRAVITGNFTEKDKATFNALGPAGAELQSAIKAQQAAAKSGDAAAQAEADARLKRATADAQAYINNKQFADIALTSQGAVAQQMKTIFGESREAQATAAGAARESGKQGVEAFREGQKNQEAEARANIKGQQVDERGRPQVDAAGKPIMDAGQALTRGVNVFDANLRTQTSALATNFERLNKTLVGEAGGAKNVTNTIANPEGIFTGKLNTQAAMENQASLIPRIGDAISKTLESLGIKANTVIVNVPSASAPPAGAGSISEPPKTKGNREGGTLEKTGSPVEPEDAIVKIHKGETVLTPEATKGLGKQVSESTKSAPKLSESKAAIVDDYKGYSEGNRQFMVQAQQAGIKEDETTVQIIGDRIAKMKADIGNRQATDEEKAAIRNEELNKGYFEKQIGKRREMLDVMENLDAYTKQREQEKKQESVTTAEETARQTSEITKLSADEQTKVKDDSAKQATEIAKSGAAEQSRINEESIKKAVDNVKETITINGKVVDPNSPEAQAVRSKLEAAKEQMTKITGTIVPADLVTKGEQAKIGLDQMFKNMDPKTLLNTAMLGAGETAKQAKEFLVKQQTETQEATKPKLGFVTEQKKQMEDMFGKIGGDLFNPKILDAKQAAINTAKFAEEDKKKAEANKPKEEPKKETSKAQPVNTAHEVTMKDLNDQLIKLNNSIMKLVSHSEVTADATTKAAKNTKQGRF